MLRHKFAQLRANATYENRHYTLLMLTALLYDVTVLLVRDEEKGTLAMHLEHCGKRYGGEVLDKDAIAMLNEKAKADPTHWHDAREFLCMRWLQPLHLIVFRQGEN